MKRLGLLGGMSWESSIEYERTINELVRERLGGVAVPLIHIADATAAAVKAAGIGVVALLATRYTMEQDFYVGRLRDRHSLTVLVPDEPARTVVHDVIYEELVRGIVSPESKARYLDIIDSLLAAGAEGVIAGCTEIELLIGQDDLQVPYFPTAYLHAVAAVDFALAP